MESEIIIEKGVPVPKGRAGRRPIYPFGNMEIGDSFFIANNARSKTQVASAASYYGKGNPDYCFTVQGEEMGCRCWRVPNPVNSGGKDLGSLLAENGDEGRWL